MKLIITKILPFVLLTYVLTSCLNQDGGNFPTSPQTSGSMISLMYNPTNSGNFNSGLEFFGAGAITFPSADSADVITFVASIQGPATYGKDITVTLNIDNNALLDNYASDSITYVPLPDSTYKILNTTAVILAGTRTAYFSIKVYPSKISITDNYGLPVTVTNDGGVPVSSNHGNIYFHAIGNPIAGNYNRLWERWNTATQTGPPPITSNVIAGFAPVNPTTINVASGVGMVYIITFKNSAGVLSNFKVAFPVTGTGSAPVVGITISVQPTVVTADPATGTYKFTYGYINSAGSSRSINDTFTK